MFRLFGLLLVGLVLAVSSALASNYSPNHSASCKFQIADMNWPSATMMANVDKLILENLFNCEIELVPGATTITFNDMNERGKPDIAVELWTNAVSSNLEDAMLTGRLHSAVKTPITELGEGWWVTPGTLKRHPELKTVLDIIERPDLFPAKNNPSKGAFIGCPSGWGCQLTNQSLFKAFDMEKKGWVLVDPGSQAGLDSSMAIAAQRDENWFGYYWSPTSLVGKYNMQRMDFGVPFAGNANWDNCIAMGPKRCGNPPKSAWVESNVHTIVTPNVKMNPKVMRYFSKRIYPGPVMNKMLVYMEENFATGPDAAKKFIEKYKDIWIRWVPPEVVASANPVALASLGVTNSDVDTIASRQKGIEKGQSQTAMLSNQAINKDLENERKERQKLEQEIRELQAKQDQYKRTISSDQKKPIISATVIYDGQTNAKITGSVTDNVSVAEVIVDGDLVRLGNDGSFSTPFYVPRSGKTVQIVAFDKKGNTATKSLFIERGEVQAATGPVFASLNPSGKRVRANTDALALIVGIADYERTPAKAAYADKDAQTFYDYAMLKLGIPAGNIKELVNVKAGRVDVSLAIKDWIARSTKQGQSDIYVYFAGHGLASDDGEKMYLLPVDGEPRLLEDSAILRDELFADISAANPRSVTVFLDTCYSGTTRGTDMLIASRPIAIRALKQSIPDNFTVMTAAAGDQTAKPLEEAKHGMFSYFLMKGMEGEADANNDNEITAGELHTYVQTNVIQQSSGSQTPELQGDADRVLVRFQ